ncbi:MAG: hypothetical protein OHK0046_51880 [Anaerolineae bacterium]
MKTVFTTARGEVHQRHALNAAPPELTITLLRQPERDTLKAALREAVYWISERAEVIDADLIAAAPQLRLILRLGSSSYDIDTAAAQAAGVIVCTWPDAGVIRVAEHVLMQMLVLSKRLNETQRIALSGMDYGRERRRTDENTFSYNWSRRENLGGLYGRRAGILGFGEIGTELARRLQPWGMTLFYNKRTRLPAHIEHELGLIYAARDDLLRESDFLINLLPYFPETDHSLDAAAFARMPSGSYVVSAGSGSVMDEVALAQAVESGHLGGAALDTYEIEPLLPDHPLVVLAKAGHNVVLTPHVAAVGVASSNPRIEDYTNILRHLRGEPVLNRVV